MGCDIHAYLEYTSSGHWCGWPRINPGRHYELFGRIAGVRGDDAPLIEPRGLPSDVGMTTEWDWFLYVDDDHADDREFCSFEQAKKWGGEIEFRKGKPYRTKHPDWHTPSWLTIEEFETALSSDFVWPYGVEYEALLAAMRSLAETKETRLVFWFDN